MYIAQLKYLYNTKDKVNVLQIKTDLLTIPFK